MLTCQNISISLNDTTVKVTVMKGCPQGMVICSWLLDMDDLMCKLNSGGFTASSYFDDLVLISINRGSTFGYCVLQKIKAKVALNYA